MSTVPSIGKPTTAARRGGVLAAVLAASLLAAPAVSGETIECVAVQINDEIITLSEIEERRKAVLDDLYRMRLPEEQLKEKLDLARTQLVPGMVEERLLLQKARNLGLAVSDEEVSQVVRSIMSDSQIPDEDALRRQLEAEGLTLNDVRSNIRRRSLIEKLKRFEIVDKVVVTEEEAQRYYEENKEQFREPELVRLRQIVLLREGRTEQEVKQQIDELANMIKNHADFAELATLFSHSPSSEHGGDLGLVRTAELSRDVAEATAKLQPGEVSPPLKADFGYHLLKLVERKEVSYRSFEESKNAIVARIQQGRFDEKMSGYVEELKEEAYIRYFEGCNAS